MVGSAQQADAIDTGTETADVTLKQGEPEKGTRAYIAGAANVGTVNTVTITNTSEPVPILNADPSRVRALIKGSTTEIYISPDRSELANINPGSVPNGYPIASGISDGSEVKSIGQLWVAYRPVTPSETPVHVYALIERLTL